MEKPEEFASGLIHSGASGYGASAAERLLERRPEIAGRFGSGAFHSWSRHLGQRARELAAAMLVAEPEVFVSEVTWARVGFDAREVPAADLRASLECLREALEADLPEAVRELPRSYIEPALAALSRPAEPAEPLPSADGEENRLALEYLEAVLEGRRRQAIDRILGAVDGGLPIRRVFEHVLMTAQRSVGAMWHEQRLSIAQEHLVTATTGELMTLLAHRAAPREADGRTVVVALVAGNAHALGARSLAHWFEMEGWNAIYLGSELPGTEVAAALDLFEAQLLALSVALSTQLRAARGAIRAAREARPGVKILVGGRVIGQAPRLAERLGADAAAADLGEALEVADRLVTS